jgi:hypothetical protein
MNAEPWSRNEMDNWMTRRSCLSALGGFAALGCAGLSGLSNWRLLYVGLEHEIKTRDFSGAEAVYLDWQRKEGIGPALERMSVEGSHSDGAEVLMRRPSPHTWEQPSVLLIYSLITGRILEVEYPFVRVVETLSGVPGVGLVTSGLLELVRRTGRVESGIFVRRTFSSDSDWEPALSGDGPKDTSLPLDQRRMWPTGELGTVVYSAEKTIYRHNLLEKRRVRIGLGDFASVSHDGKLISFLDAGGNLQLADFPSMKFVRTFVGPFRDGLVWAPHCAMGLVAKPGTVLIKDALVDSLLLLNASQAELVSLGAHRMMVGSWVLRWIGGTEATISNLAAIATAVQSHKP